MKFLILLFILLGSQICDPLYSAPKDPENYEKVSGFFADIPDHSVVEGSLKTGGTQPDYIIDTNAPELQPLLKYARQIKSQKLDYWVKINKIIKFIYKKTLTKFDYNDKSYQDLIKSYKSASKDIPISRYASCSAGVCRENAILTHLALKEAGIPKKHVYAQIQRISKSEAVDVIEDHAFTVVEHKGKKWVVDSYYWGFNGYLLDDLLRPEGITKDSLKSPIAYVAPGFRRIIKINSFPEIYVPKKTPIELEKSNCSNLFKSSHHSH
jgi:hypothetical protein